MNNKKENEEYNEDEYDDSARKKQELYEFISDYNNSYTFWYVLIVLCLLIGVIAEMLYRKLI